MRILIVGNGLDELNGQPISTFTLAKELAKNNQVDVVVKNGRLADNELKRGLEEVGVKCSYKSDSQYDLILASEWIPEVEGIKINIVRSEYECETPLPNCDFYICIRPSIQEHIVLEHKIPKEKTIVIYNGVDRERFKPIKKSEREHRKIVVPCTIDEIREKFLNYLIDTATKDNQVYIYGDNIWGIRLHKSPYAHINLPRYDIENIIADADLVAGIHLGRVNIEANSCGIPSIIYNPKTLESEYFLLDEETFDKRHNIKNVVKDILELYENIRYNPTLHTN